MCKRFRIDNSKRINHTALIDCDLLSKVYINLIDQKEPTLDFNNLSQDESNTNDFKIDYFRKIILPTRDEKIKHVEYLKNYLKKNFF